MSIVKDIWDIAKDIIAFRKQSLDTFQLQRQQRKQLLNLFSPEFVKHPKDVTDLQDYYSFVEEQSVWKSGTGRLLSATHKEILRLWAKPELISIYEAFLTRHLVNGGELSRVFVAGSELLNPVSRLLFLRVLYRHHVLGFSPRVASVLDLGSVGRNLYVDCHMFGVVNEYIAFYIRFPQEQYPIFVRTTDETFVSKAIEAHRGLVKKSESFEEWSKRQPMRLDSKAKKEVELECKIIYELAHSNTASG